MTPTLDGKVKFQTSSILKFQTAPILKFEIVNHVIFKSNLNNVNLIKYIKRVYNKSTSLLRVWHATDIISSEATSIL